MSKGKEVERRPAPRIRPQGVRRREHVGTYVTIEERNLLYDAAEGEGRTFADWSRRILLREAAGEDHG